MAAPSIEATDTDGIDTAVRDQTIAILREHPEITAVYSIGGGNQAILDAFELVGRQCRVFVAHDLDRDNLSLIQNRQITAVLHHDLRHDMRRACHVIMQANGAIDGPIESVAVTDQCHHALQRSLSTRSLEPRIDAGGS